MRPGLRWFHAPRRRCLLQSLPIPPPFRPYTLLSPPRPSIFHTPTIHAAIRPFSATSQLCARKKKGRRRGDMRITLIRYHLQHPKTPRPLRFSRNRGLRHWTIHRAWLLCRTKQRDAHERELERQFNSIRDACEALRLIGEDGLAITEPGTAVRPPGARDVKTSVLMLGDEKIEMDVQAAAERQKEIGKLYRTATMKIGVWDGVPIEYARSQTETPPTNGWNNGWTR